MSKLAEWCLLFYETQKKEKAFAWGEDCDKAFIQLKEYLFSPLILTWLKVGETLFLYIAVFDKVVRIVLITEIDGNQRLVYYTSKVLHVAKMRYQKIEKLAHVVALASKKLKHYFWDHLVIVQTDQPIH